MNPDYMNPDYANVVVVSEDMARALANVLLFCPKTVIYAGMHIRLLGATLQVQATDSFKIGRETVSCEVATTTGKWASGNKHITAEIVISREDAVELEKACRADKGNAGTTTIRFFEQGWRFHPSSTEVEVSCNNLLADSNQYVRWHDLFTAVDEHMALLHSARERTEPAFISFLAKHLHSIARVKPAPGAIPGQATEAIVEMYVFDPEDAVFLKIGPTFEGAIKPLIRERVPNPEQNLFDAIYGVDTLCPVCGRLFSELSDCPSNAHAER